MLTLSPINNFSGLQSERSMGSTMDDFSNYYIQTIDVWILEVQFYSFVQPLASLSSQFFFCFLKILPLGNYPKYLRKRNHKMYPVKETHNHSIVNIVCVFCSFVLLTCFALIFCLLLHFSSMRTLTEYPMKTGKDEQKHPHDTRTEGKAYQPPKGIFS